MPKTLDAHALWAQVGHLAANELKRRGQKQQHASWQQIARPDQLPPPGDWHTWLILAGRGFGKTRTGAETIRYWIESGTYRRIACIANTIQDARSVMIEGESGFLNLPYLESPPQFYPSNRCLRWANGAQVTFYSADAYQQLRGPQFDAAWIDEFAKFRYPQQVWQQLSLALRLGVHPRVIITTTPRPLPFLKKLIGDPKIYITRGSTYDNAANLAAGFIQQIQEQFGTSPLGRQELLGEIVEHQEGALWNYPLLQRCQIDEIPTLERIVVAIDPAVSNHGESCETGIVVAGLANGHGYVLADYSGRYNARQWAEAAVKAYHDFQADRIVAEANNGGNLVSEMLKIVDATASLKMVHATGNKQARAEPIAALYEQGRVWHKGGQLGPLENQLCTFVPGHGQACDRLDALVWALTELMLQHRQRSPTVWEV